MNWLDKVKNNIFPLSVEKGDIVRALEEWEYRGDMVDLEVAVESCQLCGQQSIRYQFEIINKLTKEDLLIGSECITRFGGVQVLDASGNALVNVEARKKVNKDKRKLVTDAQTRSLLNSLVMLGGKDDQFNIASFESDYKDRGAFTPRQLFTILWRMDKFKIPHNSAYFKLSLRKESYKTDLLSMEVWKVKRLLPCLSLNQRKYVLKHKKL